MSGKVVVRQFGGPEVLEWEETTPPVPGPGEVLVRHAAIGLNFIDVYHRIGLYKAQSPLPFTPGVEAAGAIEALGADVNGFQKGDRVAYFKPGDPGAYAERRVVSTARLVKLPDALDDKTAAAALLKGATAEYLVHRAYPVKKNDWILLHAAAGGVGLLAAQWLKALGARVIGTAGSEEKAALAKANGCEHVILYNTENVAEQVKALTGGRGVDVVYDSVGKSTIEASLASLRPRGLMVSFGNSSGAVPPIAPLELGGKGSLFLTR
ncbi:MAG TPA: quinone oxidoreductase, partial [Sphingomonadales bacterium]|nr:quinone oxidoreductase [Sphingomonadales bacterium]